MPRLLLLNNMVLFLCCSIYLGIGIFMIFFMFPLEPSITVDNYYLIFVEPVAHATAFLTHMTKVMLVTAFIMMVTEWFSGQRWVPIIVLALIIAVTLLTIYCIFPHNVEMAKGITKPADLTKTLTEWMTLNRIRASFWAAQWLTMSVYFYKLANQARTNR